MDSEREYIDYSVFLGMNAAAEPQRLRCKNFVASRRDSVILMTWDHVGRCDDIIWTFSREVQDLYYPFMDSLQSLRCLSREGYEDSTLRLATSDSRLQRLPVLHRLLVARALERGALVYTLDPTLLGAVDLPIRTPPEVRGEVAFPRELEALYQNALQLRVPLVFGGA